MGARRGDVVDDALVLFHGSGKMSVWERRR
jgi:hypothetical protein